jgi:hypothetical protein
LISGGRLLGRCERVLAAVEEFYVTVITPETTPLWRRWASSARPQCGADLEQAGLTVETGAYVEERDGRL